MLRTSQSSLHLITKRRLRLFQQFLQDKDLKKDNNPNNRPLYRLNNPLLRNKILILPTSSRHLFNHKSLLSKMIPLILKTCLCQLKTKFQSIQFHKTTLRLIMILNNSTNSLRQMTQGTLSMIQTTTSNLPLDYL